MSTFAGPPGDPAALAAAGSRVRGVAGSLALTSRDLRTQVAAAHDAWSGRRGLDFLASGAGEHDQLATDASALAGVASAVDDLGEHLERTVAEVRALERRAASLSGDPVGREALAQQAEEARRDYRAAARRVAARVSELTEAAELGRRDLVIDDRAAVTARDRLAPWLTVTAPPLPVGLTARSPAQVARWWGGLRPAQRVAVLRRHPVELGSLDGLPGWARDLANRVQLPTLRARLEHEREWPWPFGRRATDHLRALDAVEATLARGGRQLLTLDLTSGRLVHAAVAVGNVDVADNVAVLVPGYTTRVDTSLLGYDQELEALQGRADRAAYRFAKGGTPRTSAFVAWLGYDAPQSGADLFAGPFSVASPHLARQGGDALAGFLTGLNAARPHDPHLVALGHSYGSTTTGYALHHEGTGVDDAVVFGSPGLGALRAGSLRVPRGHLFALEADDDPVADIPRFGFNPDHLDGVTLLSTDAEPVTGTARSRGHSAYLADRSTSQHNIALVSIGRSDAASRDDRQPGPLLDGLGR